MRTKQFLLACALPAIFAACSSDEFTDNTEGNKPLAGRIVLDNVTFAADEANTRASLDEDVFNKIVFENGDAIGAYLVDAPNSNMVTEDGYDPDETTEATLLNGYNLTANIQANHKFVYNDGNFTTLDAMEEGNYLYVFPYVQKPIRSAITTKLPRVQELKFKEGTTEIDPQSIMKALVASNEPVAVGYQFLNRNNQVVKSSLKQIYAYPQITLDNKDGKEEITVQKVIIKAGAAEAGKFLLEGKIKLTDVNNGSGSQIANTMDNAIGKLFNIGEKTSWGVWAKEEAKAWYTTNNSTADILDQAGVAGVDYIVVNAPENMKIAAGGNAKFMAVIPAGTYKTASTANQLTIDVYTNKGVFSSEITDNTHINNGMRYPASEYSAGSMKEETGKVFTVKTSGEASKGTAIVTDTKDMISCIEGATGTALTIAPMDAKSVEINADVIKAIGNKDLTVTFTTAVGIAGGTEAAPLTLKNFVFGTTEANAATVNSGYVTLDLNKNAASVKVAKNAHATFVSGTYTTIINNEGDIQIGAAAAKAKVVVEQPTFSIQTLTNTKGTVTFNKNFTLATASTNAGTITVPTGVTLTLSNTLANSGTLNNAGTIIATGELTNTGTITNDGTLNGTVTNKATLNNNGTLMGTINNGVNGATGTNPTTIINAGADAMTFIANNYATINYGGDMTITTAQEGSKVIYVTPTGFAATDIASIPEVCNYLKVTVPLKVAADVTIPAAIKTVELAADVTINSTKTLSIAGEAAIVSSNITIGGTGTLSFTNTSSATLTFNAGTTTRIAANTTITGNATQGVDIKLTEAQAPLSMSTVYNFGTVTKVKSTTNIDAIHGWNGNAVTAKEE